MSTGKKGEVMKNDTNVERTSERELVVTRIFNGPVRHVYEAWSNPELFQRWWTPKSFGITIVSREMDIRTGGTYRLVMKHPAAPHPMTFFGRYLEVTPLKRIVWTNEENGEAGQVTTVTFEDKGNQTVVVMRDLYPTKEALDDAMASGATSGTNETFAQLDALLDTLGAGGS
jgi:uncharacterized protein YndB with AHSA1/START domain